MRRKSEAIPVSKLKELWALGLSASQIGERLGRSRNTISALLCQNGITSRKTYRTTISGGAGGTGWHSRRKAVK